jgi:RNA polymerase sigma factor for flagellar operon FliA
MPRTARPIAKPAIATIHDDRTLTDVPTARASGLDGPLGSGRVMPPEQEQLVTSTLPLVGHIVREMLAKVPAHVHRDDLVSAGMMALVVSAQNFEPARGVPFARFAVIRIRGAIMDELRGMDWAARSIRGRARETHNVTSQLCAALGRTPTKTELASAMGVSVNELDALRADLYRASVLSLQGFAPETGADIVRAAGPGPEDLLLSREQLGYLHDAIAELPDRLRTVITEYFFHQRQMNDIAIELGVTESRVSQMRAEALRLLKDGMNSQLEPENVTSIDSGRTGPGIGKRGSNKRASYYAAIANRSTLVDRLGCTTATGEMATVLASHSVIA